MLTVEVEMTAVLRDAGRKAAGPADLTLSKKVMLVAGVIVWALAGLLVMSIVVVG